MAQVIITPAREPDFFLRIFTAPIGELHMYDETCVFFLHTFDRVGQVSMVEWVTKQVSDTDHPQQ